MAPRLARALVLAVLVMGGALVAPATADPITCTYRDNLEGNVDCVGYHTHGGKQEPPPPAEGDPDAPYDEYRYVVMCSANSIANEGDVMCVGAATYCQVIGQEGTAFWVWRRRITPPGGVGDWTRQGIDCRGADEPGVPTVAQVADYVQREFQRLAIFRGNTRIDPGARGLINTDTIFSTDRTRPERLPTLTLLGRTVVITVTPEEYRWSFGDGETLTTTEPGRPLKKDVTHVYTKAGSYGASVTISWSGTFTIDGGESIPIRGRATTTGPATRIRILTAKSELVDG